MVFIAETECGMELVIRAYDLLTRGYLDGGFATGDPLPPFRVYLLALDKPRLFNMQYTSAEEKADMLRLFAVLSRLQCEIDSHV